MNWKFMHITHIPTFTLKNHTPSSFMNNRVEECLSFSVRVLGGYYTLNPNLRHEISLTFGIFIKRLRQQILSLSKSLLDVPSNQITNHSEFEKLNTLLTIDESRTKLRN